jgi:ATP-binding cassette, subfamily B, putative efflux pump
MAQLTATREARKPGNFIRFLAYVRPYKYYVLAAAIGGSVKFTVPLLVPQLTRYLVDEVYLNPAMPTEDKINELLLYVGGLIAIFVFFWAPWTFVRHYYAGKAGHKSVFDLRCDLYYRILRMSASFFDRHKSGGIVARLISDIELAQNLVGTALTNIWMDLAALVVIMIFLLQIDVGVTVAALVTFPVYLFLFRRLKRQIQSSSHRVQEEIANMSGNVQEKISGSRVVHAFAQEKNEEQTFLHDSNRLLSMAMWRVYLQSLNVTITGIIVNSAPLIVALYGGYRVISGTLTVGELIAVTMYLTPLYTPLQRFSELNVVFANAMAALDRVFAVMDEKPEIRSRPGAIDLAGVQGYVEFDGVHFAYHNSREDTGSANGAAEPQQEEGPVLRDVNFRVEPGEKVALVGPSGAGKSTVVSLIPRFYDVDSGAVRVDGHDVRDLTVESLRQQVGMVLQTPILFSGSILDNVRYGRPDATDQEVVEACRAANAFDFIMQLSRGFESEVGEGGTYLSGGQRQRLTIARAFLKDPRILILDEATSSLDTESEKLIQAALERLMEGRTTFIIAHRLSTIEKADRILVFQDGRIVETGTHHDLVNGDGVYHRLYSVQVQ